MDIFAYLDAGTGSLFIQVIIGSLLAGSVMLRSYIRTTTDKLRLAFSRSKAAGGK